MDHQKEKYDFELSRNLSRGYVKIYRCMQDEWWYRKPAYAHLFKHLLLLAAHADEKFKTYFNGTEIRLKPGQFVTGRIELSKQTGICQNTIQSILKVFEKRGSIKQQTSNKSRLITITNWALYQQPERQNK